MIDEWLKDEFDPKGLDADTDPYAEQRENVDNYRRDLEVYQKELLEEKKRKDKRKDKVEKKEKDKEEKDKEKTFKEVPKLTDDLILFAYKWKLSQNACFNRGFILDN